MTDITYIITAVITLIAAIVTVYLVPFIRSKTTAEQYATLARLASIGVYAAEQLFKGSKKGAEKKEYVMKFLKEHNMTFDAAAIEAAIEAAVKELNLDESNKDKPVIVSGFAVTEECDKEDEDEEEDTE